MTSPPRDLTRWNRGGLRRFRYATGNAATYLDLLRAALAERFLDRWNNQVQLNQATIADETGHPERESERILKQYDPPHPTDDWAWEIARTFARACHVLIGHIDAFANEGFIETATQWDYLRKLVGLLGYHPALPASALTALVLMAKPGVNGSVLAGSLRAKNSPIDGSAPIIFETLEDVAIDANLNELHLLDWNESPDGFSPVGGNTPDSALSNWECSEPRAISAGQVALLVQDAKGTTLGCVCAVQVSDVQSSAADPSIVGLNLIQLSDAPRNASWVWTRGRTKLLACPSKPLIARLNGPKTVQLSRQHGLAVGDVVAWQSGGWDFAFVTRASSDRLELEGFNALPPSQSTIYRAAPIHPVTISKQVVFLSAQPVFAAAAMNPGCAFSAITFDVAQVPSTVDKNCFQCATDAGVSAVYVITASSLPAGEVLAAPVTAYTFDGSPTGLASGDFVVLATGEAGHPTYQVRQIKTITEHASSFEIELTHSDANSGATPVSAQVALIRQVRRVEAALDESTFESLKLIDLVNGSVARMPATVIEGFGQVYPTHVPNWTVKDLAQSGPTPSARLRELRTHAEFVTCFAQETSVPAPLLQTSLKDIIAGERTVSTDDNPVAVLWIHGGFKHVLRPQFHDYNPGTLDNAPYAIDCSQLPDGALPSLLKTGRRILVEQVNGGTLSQPFEATVTGIGLNCDIIIDPPIPNDGGYTKGNTIIRGNVVRAGHGETKPERVLGSGNAAQPSQDFVLDIAGISSVPDSTMVSGVRADIALKVDGEVWTQVPSLRDSKPGDAHYTARVTEDGLLRISFGDGQLGRRLSTGTNNVRVGYRLGTGAAGNLPSGSLEQLTQPHALLAKIRQPNPASGGKNMETTSSLREHAPASVLAMGRAVSLSDYASIATSAGIDQAGAFALPAVVGCREVIDVVVVPSGPVHLDNNKQPFLSKDLQDERINFLTRHAPPGVKVTVRPFAPKLVDMVVKVRIKSAQFNPPDAIDAVLAALWTTFGLQRRKLGQSLHRAEIYGVVENLVQVENSDCYLYPVGNRAADLEVIPAQGDEVVYLDPKVSEVRVTYQEYSL